MNAKLNPVRIRFSNRVKILAVLILGLSLLSSSLVFDGKVQAVTKKTSIVVTICGNGVIEGDELCDDGANNGQYGYCLVDCSALGPRCGDGILQSAEGEQCDDGNTNSGDGCSSTCQTEAEEETPPPSGGGGGGGASTPSPTQVILQGKAYPKAELTILKDGQVATGGIYADSNGDFKVTLTTLTAGTYTFGIWAEDKQGRRSLTFSFTATVTSGMITTIGNIFLPPTIELDKTEVKRGEILNILGQTVPQSEITIKINSPGEIIKTTTSTSQGDWGYSFDTSPLEDGVHFAKAKANLNGLLSSYSNVLVFYVGKEVAPGKVKTANLNGDGRVNLIDFSILLYNWGTPKNTKADINGDGWVNLVDFSIMMYQWTG